MADAGATAPEGGIRNCGKPLQTEMFQKACHLDTSRSKIIQNGGSLPTGAVRPKPIPGRIVSSGRLERYKGHQRVIEALPIVQQSIQTQRYAS